MTSEYYQKNRERILQRQKEYNRKNRDKLKKRVYDAEEREARRQRKWIRYHDPSRIAQAIFDNVRRRAKRKNIPFDITVVDIIIPETCPITGIKLEMNNERLGDSSPSLDRIDNTLGYVKGNVAIISQRANRLKSNLSVEELKRFAEWIGKVIA